jgi:hypothetical protein
MRIYGNPRLLGTINRTSSAELLGIPQRSSDLRTAIRKATREEANFEDWGNFPSFAKINIKMPRNNDDIALFSETVSGADFTRDFWFTGFYYVVGIEHTFDGGEFTQTLSMIGIAPNDALRAADGGGKKSGANDPEQELQTDILDCYAAAFPCAKGRGDNKGPTGNSTPANPVTPPPAPGETPRSSGTGASAPTTNLADSNVAARSIDPNKVSGWNSASSTVKQAIVNASNKHGIDLGYMVAVAKKESDFRPNAAPGPTPKPDPRGLYQFIRTTWFGDRAGYGVVNQFGRQLGIANMTPAEQDAARFDPRINAEAAALLTKQNKQIMEVGIGFGYQATPADLYLAHFIGPSNAAALITAPNQNATVESVLGTDKYNQILSRNPSYGQHKTVNAWRGKTAVGLTEVAGVPVVGTTTDQLLTNIKTDPAKNKISGAVRCPVPAKEPEPTTCNETAPIEEKVDPKFLNPDGSRKSLSELEGTFVQPTT